MSKENIRRHPSMLRKMTPGEQQSYKEQIVECDSEPKLPSAGGSMGDAARNIQARIKMKKKNSKISDRFLNSGANLDFQLPTEDNFQSKSNLVSSYHSIEAAIKDELQTNQELLQKMQLRLADQERVREKLLEDANFISCQVQKGNKLSQVLERKIEGYLRSHQLEKKARQKEESILAMIDNRIEVLRKMQGRC